MPLHTWAAGGRLPRWLAVVLPIVLQACGGSGSSGTSPSGDSTPPTVRLSAPASGAGVSATVTISADASDDVGVAGVQFKLDGADLGAEDTGAPYAVAWDTTSVADGTHTVTATARDAAGNRTTSAAVSVTVSNGSGGSGAPAAMPLISRSVPATTSDGAADASGADDASYDTYYRGSVPGWLAYDLSGVPSAQRGRVLVAWYNTVTYPYDHFCPKQNRGLGHLMVM